jgi:putative hydrolase of HD superfamily
VFALIFLSQYFLPIEDSRGLLSREKVYAMILFHDFAEITHGDVPYHQKTKETETRERAAAEGVFSSLPESMQKSSYDIWFEYEEKKSPEAQFVNALDKIEPLFELLDPINEKSFKRLKFTHQDNITRKLIATEKFPIMRRFVEVIDADMLKRKIFWKGSV